MYCTILYYTQTYGSWWTQSPTTIVFGQYIGSFIEWTSQNEKINISISIRVLCIESIIRILEVAAIIIYTHSHTIVRVFVYTSKKWAVNLWVSSYNVCHSQPVCRFRQSNRVISFNKTFLLHWIFTDFVLLHQFCFRFSCTRLTLFTSDSSLKKKQICIERSENCYNSQAQVNRDLVFCVVVFEIEMLLFLSNDAGRIQKSHFVRICLCMLFNNDNRSFQHWRITIRVSTLDGKMNGRKNNENKWVCA